MVVRKNIGFKRRRQALTNYRKRLALVKSNVERIALRRSNRRIIAEVIRYEPTGDKIVAYVDSNQLAAFSWPARSNRSTAYLTGLLLAKTLAKKQLNRNDYILDIGLSSPVKNSTPFTFAKGCIDGGIKLRSGVEVDEKVYGLVSAYSTQLKKDDDATYKKQFSAYLKDGIAPETLEHLFKQTKEKIMKS